jgi:hypothetical protein
MDGARREWLEQLQRATRRAVDDLEDAEDPMLKALVADLEQLAAQLRRDLEGPGQGESSPSGIR